MKKLFVLLAIIAVICTGCFYSCENCEKLRSEVYHLEEENSEFQMYLEDNQGVPGYVLDEINSYLYGAEEYLSGQFLDVEPDEALRIIREAQDYIGDYMY